MAMTLIGLIGDRSAEVRAHAAIPRALEQAADPGGPRPALVWLPTAALASGAAGDLARFAALWCVPGSPYQSLDGALAGIRFARERQIPFLGTCGGFQHALLEVARHLLDLPTAAHAESEPDAAMPFVHRLACSLVGERGRVRLTAGSRIAAAYGALESVEAYHCRFGFNPAYDTLLERSPLERVGFDDTGALRAVELTGHPFFVATLFQPELSALEGRAHPLVRAFVRAAAT